MAYFYISFATDEGFRGATVVDAADAAGTLEEATRRDLNPGGEAAILEVPPDIMSNPDMTAMRNRLVGKDEMLANGAKRQADCSEEIQDAFEAAATRVCADCNI